MQGSAQVNVIEADAELDSLIYGIVSNPDRAIYQCDTLYSLYSTAGMPCSAARVMAIKAMLYAYSSDFIAAQKRLLDARNIVDRVSCDEETEVLFQWVIGYLRFRMGDLQSADSISLEAIRSYCPEWPDKRLLLKLYLNLQGEGWEFPRIMAMLDTAYLIARTYHYPLFELRVLNARGMMAANYDSMDLAKKYFTQALGLARQLKDDASLMTLYNNLAGLSEKNREISMYLDSAIVYATKLNNIDMLQSLYQNKALFHSSIGYYEVGYKALWWAFILKDSILNIEKYKSIADMREKYETEKRINEIQGLKLDNLNTELTSLKYKRTKNRFLGGGLVMLVFALLLGYGLVTIHKSRTLIAFEKERSENLLLNILPVEIAEELKASGKAEPRNFGNVSILFSDFKNFTDQASHMSPSELVTELNVCFEAFDRITTQYRLEKIKTIGDAYMAAGGLPIPTDDAVRNTILAALDMQEFMIRRKVSITNSTEVVFEMRIGIHTGPVVAGIVGKKKFQYDIWGDTVNTASRMETYSEVGQVNISQETYLLVKDDPAFAFTSRGLIQTKGKGHQQMWFVQLA